MMNSLKLFVGLMVTVVGITISKAWADPVISHNVKNASNADISNYDTTLPAGGECEEQYKQGLADVTNYLYNISPTKRELIDKINNNFNTNDISVASAYRWGVADGYTYWCPHRDPVYTPPTEGYMPGDYAIGLTDGKNCLKTGRIREIVEKINMKFEDGSGNPSAYRWGVVDGYTNWCPHRDPVYTPTSP
jgi:hypothetical protein